MSYEAMISAQVTLEEGIKKFEEFLASAKKGGRTENETFWSDQIRLHQEAIDFLKEASKVAFRKKVGLC